MRLAVLDLQGLTKLSYRTCLEICSNESSEFNMLLKGSDIVMEVNDAKPLVGVDIILENHAISTV